MAWCETQFSRFNEAIRLDATRRQRIDSAVAAFVDFCHRDPQLAAAMNAQPFLQGSVATGTAVRPLSGDEFDVDVIYPFALEAFGTPPTPAQVIQWFVARLRGNDFYAQRLIEKPRCARIDYAGDFHMDIIPSTDGVADHQPYAVPTKDLGGWKTNNPRDYQRWVFSLDARSGGQDANGDGRFARGLRVMKRWRDGKLAADSAPSSMLLATMLGKHEPHANYRPPLADPVFPKYPYTAAYLYDMLRLTDSCLELHAESSFENPSVPGEDLAGSWQRKHLSTFQAALKGCIASTRAGMVAQGEPEAITHYKKAFGDSFPS